MKRKPKPLTPKEKSVLEFIEHYFVTNGYAPSFTEIKEHFGFASFNSVQRYLKQLQGKNYIHMPGGNQKRAITLLVASNFFKSHLKETSSDVAYAQPLGSKEAHPEKSESLSIPFLGSVAAGAPLEATFDNETLDVPASLVKYPSKTFALSVEGDSMIEDGILNGDILLASEQSVANNGDIVIAVVENEATVKRLYYKKGEKMLELRPANSKMKTLYYEAEQVTIKGLVTGLLRQF